MIFQVLQMIFAQITVMAVSGSRPPDKRCNNIWEDRAIDATTRY